VCRVVDTGEVDDFSESQMGLGMIGGRLIGIDHDSNVQV